MFDWKLFPHTDFNKVNLEWILECLKAIVGGSTNQILAKKSDEDFDFEWIDNTGGSGGTDDYNALTNKPSINGNTLQDNKTAAQLGLVGAEVGKQLSTNDYTNADKDKLDSIVFVTRQSTFAEINAAYIAGKKIAFYDAGELFDVIEKPSSTSYRFVHITSSGAIRTAVINNNSVWTTTTTANPGSYIKYIAQTLSAAQQAQARANIGAVSSEDYNPDDKTTAMTQAVGKDSNGKLWTAPGSGGGDSPVQSVNGKTGAVVLTASDVGALPDSYTPPSAPVQSVNGKTGAVVLAAADVGAYVKPSAGIPKTDLAAAVRTSLDKADTALQSAPVTSVNGQTGDVVITAPVTSVNNKTGAVVLGAGDVGAIALKYVDVQVTSDQYAQVGNSSGYALSRILKVLSLDYRYEARLQYSGTTRVYTTGSSQAWATNVTFNIRYVIMDGDFPT